MKLIGVKRGVDIPQNAKFAVFEEANAIAFFEDEGQKVKVQLFTGRAKHPRIKFVMSTIDAANRVLEENHIPKIMRERATRSASMTNVSRQRASQTHSLCVGAILYTCWGYEQTNIDFYEVTRVISGQSIEIRKRNALKTEREPQALAGTTAPASGFEMCEPMMVRINKFGEFILVRGESRKRLYCWDGVPKNYTSYC